MPTKALSCKKEAKCKHGPEVPSCPVDQGSFKMDSFKVKVFYGQTSPNMTFLLEITDAMSSGPKRRETFQHVISVVQKQASLMVWGCIGVYGRGSLHVLEGIMNADRYIKVLEQHMLPFRRFLFQGRPCVFQQDNAQPDTAAITTAWLRSRRVRLLN
uniref:Uncharacterized protein n=1 Tax=Cyprinus carpio carpio TaxID=630221 RepID=A0A9J7YTL6_CYPCA